MGKALDGRLTTRRWAGAVAAVIATASPYTFAGMTDVTVRAATRP
jgi:hypothetical protein